MDAQAGVVVRRAVSRRHLCRRWNWAILCRTCSRSICRCCRGNSSAVVCCFALAVRRVGGSPARIASGQASRLPYGHDGANGKPHAKLSRYLTTASGLREDDWHTPPRNRLPFPHKEHRHDRTTTVLSGMQRDRRPWIAGTFLNAVGGTAVTLVGLQAVPSAPRAGDTPAPAARASQAGRGADSRIARRLVRRAEAPRRSPWNHGGAGTPTRLRMYNAAIFGDHRIGRLHAGAAGTVRRILRGICSGDDGFRRSAATAPGTPANRSRTAAPTSSAIRRATISSPGCSPAIT